MTTPRGKIIVSFTAEDGKGHFETEPQTQVEDLPGGATIRRISNYSTVPIEDVTMGGDKLNVSVSNKAGVTFLEVEMAPHQLSPLHATPSIDYGVMVSGQIWLILDSGEEALLKAGDLYIQKAANHAWENRTSEPARFATVLIASTSAET
ncbi:hypothetical protein EDB80DRAFT_729078 [Ilyonectria destructans]|nr:hypothetical protein EDB80DRAFT_729078 [Ilyonectria destructans]